MRYGWLGVLLGVLLACGVAGAEVRESVHREGPHGLEGWTMTEQLQEPAGATAAWELVVARHGRVVRRIKGEPVIGGWAFVGDGRWVAYEAGSLHFNMACVLRDVRTGKRVARYDCYHDPGVVPGWVKELRAGE